ncbi:hypothetical protein GGX14DRAFT_466621 [Mycena pura]|uniref:CsbD-like domain-containing protein n=1 Tax=Mycena pura TaxID=153505 RepID=A0AAD6Y433_9AGAR|nr:hypothetical protein GGX14DRAFT_466621 [Mycena pura]
MSSTSDVHNANANGRAENLNTAEPQPSKASGQFHSVKGTVVEMIGHMAGAPTWQQAGRDEHVAGEAEIQAAEAQAYVQGTLDRGQGKLDAVVGAVTGDREREVAGNLRHDLGKARQEANKPV